jgi:hypothetical protein
MFSIGPITQKHRENPMAESITTLYKCFRKRVAMRGQPPASQAGTWRQQPPRRQPPAASRSGSGCNGWQLAAAAQPLAPQQLASTTTCQCSHAERALRRCCPRVGPVPLRDAAFARRQRAVAAAAAAQ